MNVSSPVMEEGVILISEEYFKRGFILISLSSLGSQHVKK